ncbi:hypothetical protein PC113_g13060 [Phytophthora cactorum]|uniref:Uncharacterized protein n=2 Tax=Phytophthora cactorum TaxID=29920 RepID=A0A8T0YY50_9STRA|nr:hypothetical protein PC113_g13060 [Phytophthora cactorum]
MESKKRTSVFFAPLFEYHDRTTFSSASLLARTATSSIHDQASLSLGFFPQLHRIPHSDVEIIECVHTIPAMDACNLPLATPTDKYALSVQLTTSSNARSANAKFDQKMSAATPLSNRESDGATTAKKEALAKQFLASHATMVMAQPSNFRR